MEGKRRELLMIVRCAQTLRKEERERMRIETRGREIKRDRRIASPVS